MLDGVTKNLSPEFLQKIRKLAAVIDQEKLQALLAANDVAGALALILGGRCNG